MCLGGGGGSSYRYQEPVKYNPPPGPEAGPDTVNDIPVSDTGNYNRNQMKAGGRTFTGKASASQSDRSRGS
jgi:hypothetical protein